MSTVFMDTSFVIAIENLDDPFHAQAQEVDLHYSKRRVRYLLHWGILLEIADGYARLARRQRGFQVLENLTGHRRFQIAPIDDKLFEAAISLFYERADKEWGLTDCVSFALMQREGISEALTSDAHFRQAGFVPLLLEPA
jgi:uncharacterized protein